MSVNTNYSSPTYAAASTGGASSSSNASNTSSTTANSGLDKTFMTLLMAELQSQDPTSPMDTTAMVGQMVSLNQLNELISIQGILQNSLGAAATTQSTANTNAQPTNGVQ